MIIRMTLYDNDFTDRIEEFAPGLYDKLYYSKKKPDTISYEDWFKNYSIKHQTIKSLLTMSGSKLTKEDIELLRNEVIEEWCSYVDAEYKNHSISQHLKGYLKQNFVVTIESIYEDKSENGEVVYYFISNQIMISQ